MKLTRRGALGAGGAVGLSALIASCSSSGGSGTATFPTTGGGSATVSPQTSTASTDLFDGTASCSLTPQETEGPYYFDVDSIRGDIREDRPGTALRLAMRVLDASCTPI